MNIERGDSVKFGEKWCKEFKREELTNQIIQFTPQYFEDDNGLYAYTTECPGVFFKGEEEAESIYHLFGNEFEYFMDCELIKGTEEDKEAYQQIIKANNDADAALWEEQYEQLKNKSSDTPYLFES